MIPMIAALDKIRQALLSVTKNVFHYDTLSPQKPDQYLVWAEDSGGDDVWADDVCTYQAITGTVDYFTRTENDPTIEKIQHALNNADIIWNLNSIQYEKDTKYTHYEWEWEVSDGGEI